MSETPPPNPSEYISYPRGQGPQRAPGSGELRFEAIGVAVQLLQQKPAPYLVAGILPLAVTLVQYAVTFAAPVDVTDPRYFAMLFSQLGLSLVGWVLSAMVAAGMIRAGLKQLNGHPPQRWQDIYDLRDCLGYVLLASILVSLATAFGILLCFVGAFVFAGLLLFTSSFVVDKGYDSIAAMGASWRTLSGHWLMATLYAFVISVILGLSPLCLGVGYLIGLPVYALSIAVAYRDMVP